MHRLASEMDLKPRNRLSPLFFAPLSILVVVFLQAGCGRDYPTIDPANPVYMNWSPEATYTGRESCQECHKDNYTTYITSQMGRSFKEAKRSLSDANWDNPAPIHAPVEDLYYQPFAVGEELFVREYRIVNGDTVHNRVEQIAYIVGSGQHTNSHIRSVNGYLYQVPVTWYAQDQKWSLAPGFESLNYRFDRPIPAECMSCHNGVSPHVTTSENKFESVASGIGCEQCHGPASIHNEAWADGNVVVDVNTEIDPTIVHPGKLTPEREWDLCSRCHMQGADVFRTGVHPDDYRPGQRLADYENVFWPRQPDSVDVFKMASHPDRLSMSACFEPSWNSDGVYTALTCKTCHNTHVAIETVPDVFFSAVCQSCHMLPESKPCTEPTVVAGTSEVPCADCHMPTSPSEDIPHIRITDHYIRIPDEVTGRKVDSDDPKRVISLASIIDKNPSAVNMAQGFMSYFEKVADRQEMLAMAEEQLERARVRGESEDFIATQIWLWYLQENHAAVRQYVDANGNVLVDDAWTQLRIGEAYRDSQNWTRAVGYLQRAVDLAPLHLRFLDRLASTYTSLGDLEQAIWLFDKILDANPDLDGAHNNRGFAYLVQGKFDEAERDFRAAIDLNPDAELALANLASIYVNTGRTVEARPLVRHLIALDPDNANYGLLWDAARK